MEKKKLFLCTLILGLILVLISININKRVYKTYKLETDNLVGIYIKEDQEYIASDQVPGEVYELNKEETYCKKPNDNNKIKV